MFRNEKKDRIEMNMTTETLKNVVKTLYTGHTDINIENVQVPLLSLINVYDSHVYSFNISSGPSGGFQLSSSQRAE